MFIWSKLEYWIVITQWGMVGDINHMILQRESYSRYKNEFFQKLITIERFPYIGERQSFI